MYPPEGYVRRQAPWFFMSCIHPIKLDYLSRFTSFAASDLVSSEVKFTFLLFSRSYARPFKKLLEGTETV